MSAQIWHYLLPDADPHAQTAKILVGLVVPGSVVFLLVIQLVGAGHTTQSYLFVIGYMVCALIQVSTKVTVPTWCTLHFSQCVVQYSLCSLTPGGTVATDG